jgi:predicted enzyme related to lactoylglutathione lyase
MSDATRAVGAAAPPLLSFDSVFYYVRDLDRSVAFYREVLGLPLESRDAVARFRLGPVLLELVPSLDAGRFGGRGNGRLCFAVDDLSPAASRLVSLGVAVRPMRVVENGRLAEFTDPDGNELVLWQYD